MKHITTISYLLLSSFFLSAQSYILDTDFADQGINITDLDHSTDVATDAFISTDGAVIIGGCIGSPQFDFMLIRKKADGNIDSDFGNQGHASFDLGSVMDDGTSNTLQDDGKILIAGLTGTNSAVVRFLSDGSPDLSFGDNGKVKFELNGASLISDILVQSDGKIIIVGSVSTTASQGSIGALVIRLLPDGNLDASFGENGQVVIVRDNHFTEAKSLAINKSGKILVGINTQGYVGIVQLNSNGIIATAFGTSGYFIHEDENGSIQDLLILENEKILMTVYFQSKSSSGLIQATANGKLDLQFGENGQVILPSNGERIIGSNTFFSKNGELVMGGSIQAFDNSASSILVARFSKDGKWLEEDTAEGVIAAKIDGKSAFCAKVLEDEKGKLVVVGFVEDETTGAKDIAHIRYASTANPVGVNDLPSIENPTLFPNPVQDRTQLNYTLKQSTAVSLQLYDMQGRLITTFLQNQNRTTGDQQEIIELPSDLGKGNLYVKFGNTRGER